MSESRPGISHGTPTGHNNPIGPAKISAMPTMHTKELELDPIDLEEEVEEANLAGMKKIRAFGVQDSHARSNYTRKPATNCQGACRVRSFHGKLSEQGLEYIDNAINDWLDSHPDIEVKFVTPTIGLFDGKMKEMALVLNVWY